jgi:hypothetical protein
MKDVCIGTLNHLVLRFSNVCSKEMIALHLRDSTHHNKKTNFEIYNSVQFRRLII